MEPFGAQRKSFGNRKIVIGQAWTVILVASGGTDAAGGRVSGKVGRVEGRIRIPVVLMDWTGSGYIGPVGKLVSSAERGGIVVHRERRSGLQRGDAGDLPTAENLAVDAVVPTQKPMTRSDRQINNVDKHRSMPDIECGRTTLRANVMRIRNSSPLAGGTKERRAVVQ